jgi:hypothetical protein
MEHYADFNKSQSTYNARACSMHLYNVRDHMDTPDIVDALLLWAVCSHKCHLLCETAPLAQWAQ